MLVNQGVQVSYPSIPCIVQRMCSLFNSQPDLKVVLPVISWLPMPTHFAYFGKLIGCLQSSLGDIPPLLCHNCYPDFSLPAQVFLSVNCWIL